MHSEELITTLDIAIKLVKFILWVQCATYLDPDIPPSFILIDESDEPNTINAQIPNSIFIPNLKN